MLNKKLFQTIDRVYARALFELAEPLGVVPEVAAEIAEVRAMLDGEPAIIQLLSARMLSFEDRDSIYVKAFQGRVSDLVFRFLRVLVRKNRFDEFPMIAGAFAQIVDDRFGTIRVEATVHASLDQATIESIKSRVRQLTSRAVELTEQIDSDMIGGIKLQIGDELIDGSVVTQLRKIKEHLIESGREAARSKMETIVKA